MMHSDFAKSLYGTKTLIESPNNSTLSPAAREAKQIIPQNIVKERAALYGEQINQPNALKDNDAQLVAIYQDVISLPRREIQKINAPETAFTDLPNEIKETVFRYLDFKTLKEISKASKEIQALIAPRTILLTLALETALQIGSIEKKCSVLTTIAKEEVKNENREKARAIFALSQDTALLIQDVYEQYNVLKNITKDQFDSGAGNLCKV